MSFKSILRELKELKDGIGSMSRTGVEGKHWRNRTRSFVAPDVATYTPSKQGQWANLPPELLLDIIRRVEESETAWPARTVVVFCASVCRSWRDITKEIVKTLEECGRLTFPISLKQVFWLTHFDFIYSYIWVNCYSKQLSHLSLFVTTSRGPEMLLSVAISRGIGQLPHTAYILVLPHVSFLIW